MGDWIDSHPTACAAIEGDEIVIRIHRLALPVVAAAVVKPRSVFVGDITGMAEEIVRDFNATATANDCIGGIIIGMLTRGTPNATVLRFPDEV